MKHLNFRYEHPKATPLSRNSFDDKIMSSYDPLDDCVSSPNDSRSATLHDCIVNTFTNLNYNMPFGRLVLPCFEAFMIHGTHSHFHKPSDLYLCTPHHFPAGLQEEDQHTYTKQSQFQISSKHI